MNTNETNETTEKSIFGVFSPDEVKELHDEYKLNGNPNITLRKIATPLFRKHQIRAWDEGNQDVRDEIQTAFLALQSTVVTKTATKTTQVEHKKGDVMRDEDGTPRTDGTNSDGTPRYVLYTKNTIEKVETKIEKPFFDHLESPQALKEVERRLRAIEVLPDYEDLRKKYLNSTDFNRGCDIIRKLTKYYIFDEPEKFVERFALLICNAKAKALGYQPKWPVLFSLVGKMGVGKSWLAQMVKETHDKAFGCRSQVTSYGRLLDGQFNAMMMTRGFLSIDEAQGLDKTQCEKLKTYITSPQVDIERKGIDVKTCDNLVTFFSTTNESVKDVMGYQPDRRIIEFNIVEKKDEIPESDIINWLNELWSVMPIEHPKQKEIKDQLLADSTMVLDVKMEEIVFDLFDGNERGLMDAKNRLNQFKFRKLIKEMGGVPFARVRDWCFDKEILKKEDKSGHICVMKKNLANFLEAHRDAEDGVAFIPNDIDNMLNMED